MLKPITNRNDLRKAVNDLKALVLSAPDAAQIGATNCWRLLDHDIWAAFETLYTHKRYWTEFGLISHLSKGQRTVQMNCPLEGERPDLTGLIAQENGRRWLCHWGYLNADPKITNPKFDEAFDLVEKQRETVAFSGGRSRKYYRVGCIDSANCIDDLAEYVLACGRVREYWKSASTARPLQRTNRSLFERKLPRRYSVPPRDPLEINSRHDAVVNALAEALSILGCDPSDERNMRRGPDLFFGDEKSVVALFEVKTQVEPYSIYTGIGQLFFYGSLLQSPSLSVLVIPDKRLSEVDAAVLPKLGIKVLRYADNGKEVRFVDDLNALVQRGP